MFAFHSLERHWIIESKLSEADSLMASKSMFDRGQLVLHCLVSALERILCTFLGTRTDDRLSRFVILYKGWRNSLTIWTSQGDHSNSVWLLLTNISCIGGEVEPLEEPKHEADLGRLSVNLGKIFILGSFEAPFSWVAIVSFNHFFQFLLFTRLI